jgi:hypothetical protein
MVKPKCKGITEKGVLPIAHPENTTHLGGGVGGGEGIIVHCDMHSSYNTNV